MRYHSFAHATASPAARGLASYQKAKSVAQIDGLGLGLHTQRPGGGLQGLESVVSLDMQGLKRTARRGKAVFRARHRGHRGRNIGIAARRQNGRARQHRFGGFDGRNGNPAATRQNLPHQIMLPLRCN